MRRLRAAAAGWDLRRKQCRCRGLIRVAMRLLGVVCLVALSVRGVQAQEYRFRVRSMTMDVYAQPDASVRLAYKIVFENAPGAHPIDIVDVGLPHPRYRLSSMQASIDGQPVTRIQPSEYIDVGVECHLRSGTIAPGGTGTFEFSCVMPDMVYADTTDKQYASFQIRPTWFDPTLQTGTTELKVALHLPPGVLPEQVRYQQEKQRYAGLATWGEGDQQHTVAYWESDEFQLSPQNPKFSVSFPRSAMQRVVEKTTMQLFLEWFDGNPQVKVASGVGLFATFVFLYYRFAGATGCVPFAILSVLLVLAMVSGPGIHLLCWPALLALVALNETYLSRRKPKTYLPAMATVEGGGIKRGLTAPQAAILLEMPLSQVLTMVVFGLLKKRVLHVVKEAPLEVEVLPEFRGAEKSRMKQAAANGIVLHDYENPFLDQLEKHTGPIDRCDLNTALGQLIKSTADRMGGFDLGRTKEYYQRIVKRAWQDAESVGEIEMRDKVVDRNFEWMMMEPRWTDLFEGWRRRGYSYRPRWSRPIIIVDTPSSGGTLPRNIPPQVPAGGSVKLPGGGAPSGGGGAGSGGAGPSPTFSEVAGSFIGWAENTANQMAKSVEPTSMGLNLPTKGVIDLTSVDRVTGDFFEALAKASAKGSSGRGSGGGGGGCACACAGCACACAAPAAVGSSTRTSKCFSKSAGHNRHEVTQVEYRSSTG